MTDACASPEAFAQELVARFGAGAIHCVIFTPPDSDELLGPLQAHLRRGRATGEFPAVKALGFQSGCRGSAACAVALLDTSTAEGDALALATWLQAQPGVANVRVHELAGAPVGPNPPAIQPVVEPPSPGTSRTPQLFGT